MTRSMSRFLGVFLLAHALWGYDPFRSTNSDVEAGNAKLTQGKTKAALDAYERAAKSQPDQPGVHYNRGIALYKLKKFDDARKALLKGTAAADPSLKQRAFYNLGNTFFQLKRYRDAIDAYRRSLRIDAGHRASKWNLELALRRKKVQDKKKQQQDKKRKQQDKKKGEQKKKRRSQDKQNRDQQKKKQGDRQDKQKQQDKQDKQKQQKQTRKDKRSPNDHRRQRAQPKPKQRKGTRPLDPQMRRALDTLDRNDKNLQKRRLRMLYGGRRRPAKDW